MGVSLGSKLMFRLGYSFVKYPPKGILDGEKRPSVPGGDRVAASGSCHGILI